MNHPLKQPVSDLSKKTETKIDDRKDSRTDEMNSTRLVTPIKKEVASVITPTPIGQTIRKPVDYGQILSITMQFVIVPLIILIVAIRMFAVKTAQREILYSSKATISREVLEVGSDGYGTVNAIKVGIGDYVNKGDVLYTYYNARLDEKIFALESKKIDVLLDEVEDGNISLNEFNHNVEFNVRAKKDGYIKDILISEGSFITRGNTAMEMETVAVTVEADVKVPPHFVDKLEVDSLAYVKLSPSITVEGSVENIYPTYNSKENTVKIDVQLNSAEIENIDLSNMYTGAPVDVVVYINDPFTNRFQSVVESIKIRFVRDWLSYEVKQ